MDLTNVHLSITVAITAFLTLGVLIWKQSAFQAEVAAFIKESAKDDKEMKSNIEECYKEIAEVNSAHQRDIRSLEISNVKTDGKIDTLIEKVSNMIREFQEFKKDCSEDRE